jgi:hypothetical protein
MSNVPIVHRLLAAMDHANRKLDASTWSVVAQHRASVLFMKFPQITPRTL